MSLRANDSYSPFPSDVDPEQLRIGTQIEASEHHLSQAAGRKVALEHLAEDPNYYAKLGKMEGGSPLWGWDGLFKF